MKKLVLLVVFLSLGNILSYGIKKPVFIKPADADNVSLQPLFEWTPVNGAANYTLKIKEIDSDGLSTLVESATIASPDTQYRLEAKLNSGGYYKAVLRAVKGNGVSSAKKKLFFKAKEKFILISHTEMESTANRNAGADESYERNNAGITGYTIAKIGPDNWGAVASIELPDGAIITGFEAYYVDNTVEDSIFSLVRANENTSIVPDGIVMTTSTGTESGIRSILTTSFINPDFLVVDNDLYRYEMDLVLANQHIFIKAKVYYID